MSIKGSADMRIESVRNFRDIGGIRANGCGKIREGLLFRSATVDNISGKDIKLLKEMNIRTIIDLRAPQEARRFRRKITGIDRITLSLDFQNKTRERIKPYIYRKGSEQILADISNQLYLEILDTAAPVFRRLVELIINEDAAPILVHCQAGKDRTGIIIALLLLALGADREQIRNDFLRSNDELLPWFRKMMRIRKILTLGRFPAEQMLQIVAVKERNINSVIDRVQMHYNGIEGYLSSTGFDTARLKELRQKICTG